MKKISILIVLIPLLLFSSIPTDAVAQESTERTINDEIIYSILVDRFNNGRQAPSDQVDVDDPLTYNGGDIEGITDRLDQVKEAGFTSISVSPIMENAEKGYHGYWVEDFYEVEDEFGNMEDVETLVKEAHDKDINVILELDLNYIAKTSPLVKEHPDWFKEVDVDPIPATEWLADVMAFDQTNPDVQAYLMDVASYWMNEVDIDGYTLHAADQIEMSFLKELTATIKEENPAFYLLATTLQGEKDVEALIDVESIDLVSNGVMYEAFNQTIIEPDQPVSDLYEAWKSSNNDKSLLYVDNMNTPRFSNNFAEKGRTAETTWDIALAYLYLTPGVPMVYQGSEVPMYGPGFPENQYLVDFTSADPDLEDQFAKMAAVREEFEAIRKGDMELVDSDEGFSLFKRTYNDETVYVGINNDSESRVIQIDGLGEDIQLKGLLRDDTIREHEDGDYYIGLERESAEVYVVRPNTGLNWGFISFVGGVLLLFVFGIVFLKVKQKRREKQAK